MIHKHKLKRSSHGDLFSWGKYFCEIGLKKSGRIGENASVRKYFREFQHLENTHKVIPNHQRSTSVQIQKKELKNW